MDKYVISSYTVCSLDMSFHFSADFSCGDGLNKKY